MLQVIPDRETCEILIQRFVHTFNATHVIVDGDMFQAEVATFFEQKQAKSSMWLALFIAILAIGWQLPVIPFTSKPPSKRGRAHGRRLISFVQSIAFTSATGTSRPSLIKFQLILIIILSHMLMLDWVDGSDVVSGLLGLANRMAVTMGLHRDSSFARRYSAPEAQMRRSLWLTLNFIDFEHGLQSGMPFNTRESDSDVSAPEAVGPFWPDYQKYLHNILPLWAAVARLTTSSKAPPSKDELFHLQQRLDSTLAQLYAPTPIRHGSIAENNSNGITAQIQCTMLRCLGHRLNLVLNSPLLMDDDQSIQLRSAQNILISTRALLSRQFLLWDTIDASVEPDHGAWVHFEVVLSHCNTYYAANSLLYLMRQCFTGEVDPTVLGPGFDPPELVRLLRVVVSHEEQTLTLSVTLIKEHMALKAQVSNANEQMRLMVQRDFAAFKLSIVDEEPIVHAMQQAMTECITRARVLIDEAAQSDDPPASLCGGLTDDSLDRLREDVKTDMEAAVDTAGPSVQGEMGLFGSDFTLTDWTMDQDLAENLLMDLPWWSTSPF
ncbi:hypothetical protein AAFC00_006843 [Neodothiora populina]|uniref:Xylanolytic transcriptional activator regulatory domain-containing protein n=3 Tax=Neodothiora populina TaxID=2781224 RepID=A0ABR3PBK1_9PEZI